MDRPSKSILARMPLAEAVLLLWQWVTSEERLAGIWERHRGRCYEKVISFRLVVQLIADALLTYDGSGRRAFERGIEQGKLDATIQAAFKKLGRLPVALSQAFLIECTAALRAAFPGWAKWQLPESLRGFSVPVIDGKAIERIAKRLKPLRGAAGGLLGGRVLAALDWSTGLIVGMHAHEDGDANDVRFLPELLPTVRENVPGPRLWVADRAFCDLTQPEHFTADEGDHFLVRYHPKTGFHRDAKQKQRRGKDERGRKYVQRWGYLGSESDTRRRYVRTITVERSQAKPLILITDLLDADAYPADDLLWLYAERWGIETVFQKVTEVFGLKDLIGGSPKACIFQLAFCLLLYNMLQVIRGYLAEARDIEPEELSMQKLFEDVEEQLVAWNVVFDPQVTLDYFHSPMELPQLQARMRELFSGAWSNRWLKSPVYERGAKPRTKKTRTHQSVYRILNPDVANKRKRRSRSP